jgi:hypothetical protein
MPSVVYAECRYAECHYAECRFAECHYAECRFAEFRGDRQTDRWKDETLFNRKLANFEREGLSFVPVQAGSK